MTKNTNTRPISWRAAGAAGRELASTATAGGRIALLVEGEGNRRQLAEHLRRHYELVDVSGDTLSTEGFDLAVVDGPGFRRWHRQLSDAKAHEEPVFLPVMLIVPRQEMRRRMRAWWDTVDEFVIAPVDRTEFAERAAMLLRARHLALAQQSHLAHIVNHDRSTGLPTKSLFLDRVQNTAHNASILDQRFFVAVVRIPLMRIMKSLGHAGLERAARACTSRLKRLLKDDHSLARLTTEEWGVMVPPHAELDDAVEVCRRVAELGEAPLDVFGERVHVAPYIGVSVYPDDATAAESALDCAIAALSQTTRAGEPKFYSRSVQHRALRHIRTEARLHEGLRKNQFELWYQPKLRLADGALAGVEALVRWRLPDGQLVPPGDFIGVAEGSGLIRSIDWWVLETACDALARWRRIPGAPTTVAVNVTPSDLSEPGFESQLRGLLDRYAVPPASLELELTETMLCESPQTVLETLLALREAGLHVSVDDFGTGYSSLSYLHRLPVSVLKIDKAFVDDVLGEAANDSIARAIVWLARSFGLETVAEGVESADQVERLLELGVPVGQGYFFGKPMPEAELMAHLQADLSAAPGPA